MPMYDYICLDCGETFEKITSYNEVIVECKFCNKQAKRKVSAPRVALDGTDPAFPTAWDKWEKTRYNKMAQERKQER